MKISEAIQRVQSLYSKGVESDDSRLTSRHIYNKLVSSRARVLEQSLKQRTPLSEWTYTTFNCVELEKVEGIECPCLPPAGCKVWRSKLELPKPIMGKYNESISWVMGVLDSGSKTVYLTQETLDSMRHVGSSRYTKDNPRYVISNGYLYVYGMTMSSSIDNIYVRMRMLVEDPIDTLALLHDCNQTADCSQADCPECVDYGTLEFSLDDAKTELVIDMALGELVSMFSASSQDLRNNMLDEKVPRDVQKTKSNTGQES